MASAYRALLAKLDEFIRKYYKNHLIRGSVLVLASVPAFYLFVTLLEGLGHFGTGIRTILFYSFILVNASIIGYYIVVPLLKLYRIGKIISHEQAASIIGAHFSEVKDKLINILQLKELADASPRNLKLIEAGINQKIEALHPVPFTTAIDLKKNFKSLHYALIPLIAFATLLFVSPGMIKESTKRLVQHSTYFEKPAPFKFVILNESLTGIQQEDFQLKITTEGEIIPSQVYVQAGASQLIMEKESRNRFAYRFKNLQKSFSFRLQADGYESRDYTLNVLPNPVITGFEISLNYPAYLKRENETIRNTGDLVVPAGTKITWIFKTSNTDEIKLAFDDTLFRATVKPEHVFTSQRTALRNMAYSITTSNQYLSGKDSMWYAIQVIPDMYPSIAVEQEADSITGLRIYFSGLIKDDYGFTNLRFAYRFINKNSTAKEGQPLHENIPFNHNSVQDAFFFFKDIGQLKIQAGEELEYYFEVWDNDGINGPKASRSQVQIFKAPTLDELAKQSEQSNTKIKDDLKESIEQAKKLQREISETSKKLLNKNEVNYDDRKKVEDLLNRQKELENKVKSMQQENQQKQARENEYKNQMQELAEKQQQLQELMDQLLSDEMKKMMQELEKLLSQLDKNKMQEMLDQMKLDSKEMEKRLDRTLELFKQLELEQKMKEAISNLEKLAEEQNKLSEKSKQKDSNNKELQQQQQEMNQKFEDLKKDIAEMHEKNKELEFPQEISDTQKEQQEISEQMGNSEQELGKNQKNKASQSQKNAADKMEQMAMKMQQQMQQNQMEQHEEDMQALRALLENLIRFSLDQEDLMEQLKTIDINNPQYVRLGQQQQKLKEDAQVIEDSLFALSKRVMQIQSLVNEQIGEINRNTAGVISNLQDRNIVQARVQQQNIMMAANNLALMLSEALQQMQQQMQSMMQSNSSCQKPGKGKPKSAAQLRMMQQQMNEMLKQMKGKMDGQGKPSNKQGQQMSEELARMAAMQEAIRQELQKLNQEENKDGQGSLGNLNKIAQQMEETEKDIVNKRITQETLMRQQDILTRLLESEKAERQREQDDKRESTEGRDIQRPDNARFEEYLKQKMRETELLKTVPPSLNPFYRNLVNSYFQNLEKE
ncbi:MAG: DUF4175 domain-containing protein [Bacteroidia bacterium]|nr:DUF4175 domain-containing protein [Bacteroidia bacterium]MCZ2278524.1 DUF4175 domain-containing protein [Bacteroidia bacterium]